jgi:hypothetical protein
MPTQYTAEQILRAHTFALEAIAEFLVVSGKLPAAHMSKMIEVGSAKLEAHGHTAASEYLRTMWASGLNGEWEKLGRAAGTIK